MLPLPGLLTNKSPLRADVRPARGHMHVRLARLSTAPFRSSWPRCRCRRRPSRAAPCRPASRRVRRDRVPQRYGAAPKSLARRLQTAHAARQRRFPLIPGTTCRCCRPIREGGDVRRQTRNAVNRHQQTKRGSRGNAECACVKRCARPAATDICASHAILPSYSFRRPPPSYYYILLSLPSILLLILLILFDSYYSLPRR